MSKNFSNILNEFSKHEKSYIPSKEFIDSCSPWNNNNMSKEDYENESAKFVLGLSEAYEEFGPNIRKTTAFSRYGQIDSEVGDDHFQFTDSPLTFLGELITAPDLFGVEISKKDTFVSSRYANYSENYILKPLNHSEIHVKGQQIKGDIVYFDIAKIRVLLPVCAMRQKYSDTLDGKVSLLATSVIYETPLNGTEVRLAACIQTTCLGLKRSIKFPYLPSYLGGLGMPPLFDNSRSLCRSILSFKGGTKVDLLTEVAYHVTQFSKGIESKSRMFLNQFKGMKLHYRDWYSNGSLYSQTLSGRIDPTLNEFFVGRLGDKNEIWDQAARRLIQYGTIVTEDQLLVHQQVEERSLALVSSRSNEELLELLRKIRDENKARSEFASLWVKGRIENYIPHDLTVESVETLLKLTRKGNHILKTSLKDDRLYLGQAVDISRIRGIMRVNLNIHYKLRTYPILLDFNLSEEDQLERDQLLEYLLNPKLSVPQMDLDDDMIILENCRSWVKERPYAFQLKLAVIITDDTRLCLNINRQMNIPVIRISPQRTGKQIERLKNRINEEFADCERRVFVDTSNQRITKNRTITLNGNRYLTIVREKFKADSINHRALKKVHINKILKYDGKYDWRGLLGSKPRQKFVRFSRSRPVDETERSTFKRKEF